MSKSKEETTDERTREETQAHDETPLLTMAQLSTYVGDAITVSKHE